MMRIISKLLNACKETLNDLEVVKNTRRRTKTNFPLFLQVLHQQKENTFRGEGTHLILQLLLQERKVLETYFKGVAPASDSSILSSANQSSQIFSIEE